jgi:beta-glucosidase
MPKPRLTVDGHEFRDLNNNGRLDIYEDVRQPMAARVEDLLQQMTLAEKAGCMFHHMIFAGEGGTLLEGQAPWGGPFSTQAIFDRHVNHEGLSNMLTPTEMITWHNALQQKAEETRLGIPMTISSDPRHGVGQMDLNNQGNPHFSQWPEPIGLGAINDVELTRQFGEIARQEYRAIGIHVALHPMCDLATEPRWSRIVGTFGEDAERSARLTDAYVRGFQGDDIGAHSVLCMTKHFPGGGPQLNGEDPHFYYGREQVYPGNNFDYHLIPFEAAFAAGTAQIMPYYGMPIGTAYEEVGFGFNKSIITGLLREKYGFDGVVCTDWGLLTDLHLPNGVWVARAWGVEHLSTIERVKRVIEAGVDQFGGEECPELIIELVESGQVSMERIDQSVRRILRDKFRLGLFDNPYIDMPTALATVGNAQFRAAGDAAQRRAVVPLHNRGGLLPHGMQGKKVYVEGMDVAVVAQYATVVTQVEDADVAIIRLKTPYYLPENGLFLEMLFHRGELDFTPEALAPILALLKRIPTVVDIYLDRPAVIPEIDQHAAALLGSFGARDAALCDIIFGRVAPSGTLPFELPSSMEAVKAQKEDLPYDSVAPLYPFGHGLTW